MSVHEMIELHHVQDMIQDVEEAITDLGNEYGVGQFETDLDDLTKRLFKFREEIENYIKKQRS